MMVSIRVFGIVFKEFISDMQNSNFEGDSDSQGNQVVVHRCQASTPALPETQKSVT